MNVFDLISINVNNNPVIELAGGGFSLRSPHRANITGEIAISSSNNLPPVGRYGDHKLLILDKESCDLLIRLLPLLKTHIEQDHPDIFLECANTLMAL